MGIRKSTQLTQRGGLLVRAEATVSANGRDVIHPHDLPITKGLEDRIDEFKRMNAEIGLDPILEYLATKPPLDLACSDETDAALPRIAGSMSTGLAIVVVT